MEDPEQIKQDIVEELGRNPDAVAFAFVDPEKSGAVFELPEDGDIENVVKAIGLLIMKVSIQTEQPPDVVAREALGMATHLMGGSE